MRVLGIDLCRDEHRRVAQRASVEDRRDLADDPLVEQALGAAEHLGEREAGRLRDRDERMGFERKRRLQQVHQPLVRRVKGHGGAVLPRAELGLGDLYRSHPAASFA